MRHPETRAVLGAVSGAGMLLAALMQLALADGWTLSLAAATVLAIGGTAALVGGIRAYRRLRDLRAVRDRDPAARR